MADANGSSSGGGGGVGLGDFVGGAPRGYQPLFATVHTPAPGAPNVHQYRAGLIDQPVAMPVPVPPPYVPPQVAAPPPLVPSPQHRSQSHLPPGSYQDWTAPNNVAAQQVPRGFVDWTMYNGAFMSLAQAAAYSNNSNHGFHQNLTPCSTNTWPNYMLRNPSYSTYPPAIEDHQAPSFHNNNHEKDSGFATRFRLDQSIVPASPFPPMSPGSNSGSSAQIFNEAAHTQKVRNLEDPQVFRSSDMESENSDELDHTRVGELPSLNESHESWTARFNCREYRLVLRKELTNSDVGNIGRIVLPKRDAEASLPALLEREGVILKMDDFKLPATWNFKYRFWPNNKSRMYLLETTGEFVKSHGLQTGDTLIIYKSSESGRLVVRGEKAIQQSASVSSVPCLECSCKKEGNSSEGCRFAMSLQTKRT